jgi:2-amino-4-hydroxy-6-hydroxymethyldihydropteridine diphosphokinase
VTLPQQPTPLWLEWAAVAEPRQAGLFTAFVGLGANLGDAHAALESALRALHQHDAVRVERVSSAYRSAPVDAEGPDYVNAVAQLSSLLGPLELLHVLQALEAAHGRERPYRHAPRTLDLDLLWYGGIIKQGPELILPHPRWDQRAFVLEPLAQLLTPTLPPSDHVDQHDTAGGLNVAQDSSRGLAFPTSAMPSLPSEARRAQLAAEQKIERSPRPLSFE